MQSWMWFLLWGLILLATGYLYWNILSALRIKSAKLTEQLQVLENNLLAFEAETQKPGEFNPAPSAIEAGEFEVARKYAVVQHERRKAKAARERRLIAGLKNESRKL